MPDGDVDVSTVEKETRAVIQQAVRDGILSELTPRLVRKEVERRLGLDAGVLDAQEYKNAVKTVTVAAMEELDPDLDPDADQKVQADSEDPGAKRQRKASEGGVAPDSRAKGKSKAKAAPGPRAKKTENVNKKTDEKTAAKRGKAAKPVRSPSVVPSSDEEEVPSASKPKSRSQALKSKETVDTDEDADTASSAEPPAKRQKKDKDAENTAAASPKAKAGAKPRPKVKPVSRANAGAPAPDVSAGPSSTEAEANAPLKAAADDSGYKSASEMSVLIDDEPPKKRARKRGKDKAMDKEKPAKAKEPKERKKKQPTKDLSKDEETIKRLKSLVVACGVRKVWAKEFKGLDTPAAQIARLRALLAELGMTGRMSLEQARAIREKRELAQELEDVQNFEKSIVSQPSASSRGTRRKAQREDAMDDSDHNSDENNESDEDVVGVPKRRKTARQSIMAFLGDQSDDE
ncbi:hypothetical protein AcW1_006540 [Taiwanofungus camphoratus]|nr:hypothetical protein AcW1_006540 [Antrodia cinnamomea]